MKTIKILILIVALPFFFGACNATKTLVEETPAKKFKKQVLKAATNLVLDSTAFEKFTRVSVFHNTAKAKEEKGAKLIRQILEHKDFKWFLIKNPERYLLIEISADKTEIKFGNGAISYGEISKIKNDEIYAAIQNGYLLVKPQTLEAEEDILELLKALEDQDYSLKIKKKKK